jgi:hypothetical protein
VFEVEIYVYFLYMPSFLIENLVEV